MVFTSSLNTVCMLNYVPRIFYYQYDNIDNIINVMTTVNYYLDALFELYYES